MNHGTEKRAWENRVRSAGALSGKIVAGMSTVSLAAIIALINLAWDNGEQIGYIGATVSQNAESIESNRVDMQEWLSAQELDLKDWTRKALEQERHRWLNGGPVYTSEILDIWRAIASIPTDDQNAWTVDGKPRIHVIRQRLDGRDVSAATRDMAWALLKMSKTIRH